MSSRLPAVVRAMILASLSVCALWAGCGGASGGAVAGVAISSLTATGSPLRLALDGVPARGLADRHIKLIAVEAAEPRISQDEAESRSIDAVVDLSTKSPRIKEAVLAQLVIDGVDPSVDRLVWAVNFDPAGLSISPIGGGPLDAGPTPDSPLVPQYAVAFIDAETGDLLYLISSATQEGPSPKPDER